jgi:hypothetical protein
MNWADNEQRIAQFVNWADLYVAFEVKLLASYHILAKFMNWAEND